MTSNHEGVSCDSCKKNNFRGLRYKCLICYDYDLCSACYESGSVSSRHTVNHPMQSIIARNDYDLFYSGEATSYDQPQSLTCPLCGSLGFTESTLLEHVTSEHGNNETDESTTGVVCPICGVETNQLTYDFATHLTMEHRSPREPLDQIASRGRGTRCHTRAPGPRGRRSQPHYSTASGGGGGPTGSSLLVRDSADSLVEIIAQLTGHTVRRAGGNTSSSNQSPASQLHQLQMQLNSSPRSNDREVRIMRRTFQSMNNQLNSSSTASTSTSTATSAAAYLGSSGAHYSSNQPFVLMDHSSLGAGTSLSSSTPPVPGHPLPNGSQSALTDQTSVAGATTETSSPTQSQYLLPRCMNPVLTEAEQQQREILKADRSLFVQELLLQLGLLEKNNK